MISRTRTTGGVFPLVVTPIGDWVGTGLLIADLNLLIAAGSKEGQKSAATKLMKLVRRNLKIGGAPGKPFAPLKKSYAEQKAAEGFDPNRILYRTGLYYRSIKVWAKGSKYYVGVKRGVKASGSNHTVGWVAHILERGSSVQGIIARPLWVPTFKQFGGSKRIRAIIVWHIARLIYLRHGVRVKIY